MNGSGFLASFITDLRSALRHGLWVAIIVGTLSAAIDTAAELYKTSDTANPLVFWLVTNPLESAAMYIISMSLLSLKPSLAGFAKGMAAILFLFSPMILLELLTSHIPSYQPQLWYLVGGAAIVIGMISWIIAAMLLAAWPLAQALSNTLINPEHILVATRGYRTPLILINVAFIPIMLVILMFDPTASTGSTIGYFLANAGSNIPYLLFQAAMSVTALKFAMVRDPELARKLPRLD